MSKKKDETKSAKAAPTGGDLLPPVAPPGATETKKSNVAQPPSAVNQEKSSASSVPSVADNQKPPRDYTPNPVVTETPVACPRCKSTKSRVTHTTRFPHRPLHVNGKTYPGRIVRRRICEKCARHFVSNAPIEAEPQHPKPTPCHLCDGRGMFPRDEKRNTRARLCPACNGSGLQKEATADAEIATG